MNATVATATAPGTRRTADERRAEILDEARRAFAATGLDGTSTETIAERVGISQPYLFRLFGTKKQLFIAAVEACFADTLQTFRYAVEHGDPDLPPANRIGEAYAELIQNRSRLRMQMQAYTACDDPHVLAVVQKGFAAITTFIQEATGFGKDDLAKFMAKGMLLNVMATIDALESTDPWATMLREVCMGIDFRKPQTPFFSSTKVVSAY
jgi:AcrR family transcriptional regulator